MITKKAGEKHMAERRAEGREQRAKSEGRRAESEERNIEVISRRSEGATGRGGETG